MIYVVGNTTPKEVYVVSNQRPFVMDEYLIIEDKTIGDCVGEVINTYHYPNIKGKEDLKYQLDIYNSLCRVNMACGSIYLAKVKILEEYAIPIASESKVRTPNFNEIEKLLMPTDTGIALGVINGTGDFKVPDEYSQVAPLFKAGVGVVPQKGLPFILDHYMFREYPHIGFFGGSGSGKTFGIRCLAEGLMEKGIPAIIFDPHNEFSFDIEMPGYPQSGKKPLKNMSEVFVIGKNVGINFSELRTEEIISLLEFVAELTQPMIGALEALHEKNDSFVTLYDRVNKLRKAFEYHDNKYRNPKDQTELSHDIALIYERFKEKVSGTATLQALSWRLSQLNKIGIFNCDISGVEACLVKRKTAVIRGKQKHLKMLASYLITKLYRKRRAFKDYEQSGETKAPTKFPPFFIIVDEAHDFAPNGNYSNPAKRILREISQEARKYGVFEVFGTQRPSLLDMTITAQLNTKVIFRTNIEADMQMIAKETNLNEQQVKRLPELSSGNAFISSATLKKTMYIRFKATRTISPNSEHPYDELNQYDTDDKLREWLLANMPIKTGKYHLINSEINAVMNRMVPLPEVVEILDLMVMEGLVSKVKSPLGADYSRNI